MEKPYDMKDIEKVNFSRLDDPVYIRVPDDANGKRKYYLCKVEPAITRGQVLISTDKIPTKYHIDGLLMYDEHEPTKFGEELRSFALDSGIDISYSEKTISYCLRTRKKDLPTKLTRFARSVADVSRAVDRMILAHLKRTA